MTAAATGAPARPGRRWLRRAVALVVVAALAAGAAWWLLTRRDRELNTLAEPAAVDLPATPDDPAPTAAYFGGSAAALPAALTAVDWAAIEPETGACTDAAAALDAIAPPVALRELSAGSPDDPTGDMARSFVDTAIAFLGNCLAGDEPDPADVRFAAEVFNRRLEQIAP